MKLFLLGMILAAVLGSATALGAASSARADTQWFGAFQGKTYRNNYGNFQTGPITFAYCAGGAWGGTYNATSTAMSADLRTDKWATSVGIWGWRGGARDWRSSAGGAPAEVVAYNGQCSRGITDHNGNFSYVGTTSDGY